MGGWKKLLENIKNILLKANIKKKYTLDYLTEYSCEKKLKKESLIYFHGHIYKVINLGYVTNNTQLEPLDDFNYVNGAKLIDILNPNNTGIRTFKYLVSGSAYLINFEEDKNYNTYDEAINEVLRIAGVKQLNEDYDDFWENEDYDDFWEFESGEYLDNTDVYPKDKLSPQFWNWFGNSKIKDEKGNPIIVYHSSNHDFNMFRRNPKDKDRIGGQVGYFFTNSLEAAEHWGDTGMIYDCFLKIENPIYIDGTQDFTTLESRNNLLIKAKQQGYDGAIIKHTDIGLPHYTDEYIAFYARQIKLIDNQKFGNNRNINETKRIDI